MKTLCKLERNIVEQCVTHREAVKVGSTMTRSPPLRTLIRSTLHLFCSAIRGLMLLCELGQRQAQTTEFSWHLESALLGSSACEVTKRECLAQCRAH